jgi:hypothetical protein
MRFEEGHPLSPHIFNVILAPLLEQLQRLKRYQVSDNVQMFAMAFTDNLILLANKCDDAQNLFAHIEEYPSKLGMEISSSKCASFHIMPTEDSWYIHGGR